MGGGAAMFVDDDIEAPNVTADLQRYDEETVGESSMCGCACQASAVLRRAYHWIPLLFPRCVQAISVGLPRSSAITSLASFPPETGREGPADSVRYCYLPISKIRSRNHPCPHYKSSSCRLLLLVSRPEQLVVYSFSRSSNSKSAFLPHIKWYISPTRAEGGQCSSKSLNWGRGCSEALRRPCYFTDSFI